MKKTFLLLRPKTQSQEMVEILENKGFEVIVEPIFSVQKLTPPPTSKQGEIAAIITSANACDCLIAAQIPFDAKIFAIGKKTAKKLLEVGYKNILYPQNNSAQSLLLLVLKHANDLKMAKIYYFCGDVVTVDFSHELNKIGLAAQKIAAYKINWHQNFSEEFLGQITKKPLNCVLIYSQNSAKNFYKLAKSNNLLEYFGNSRLLCFSEKIMQEVARLGFVNFALMKNETFNYG